MLPALHPDYSKYNSIRAEWLADPSNPFIRIALDAEAARLNAIPDPLSPFKIAPPIRRLRSPRFAPAATIYIPADASGDEIADQDRNDLHFGEFEDGQSAE